MFLKDAVTYLHHKWCVHSILPLATRAKLYLFMKYTMQRRKHLTGCRSNMHTHARARAHARTRTWRL